MPSASHSAASASKPSVVKHDGRMWTGKRGDTADGKMWDVVDTNKIQIFIDAYKHLFEGNPSNNVYSVTNGDYIYPVILPVSKTETPKLSALFAYTKVNGDYGFFKLTREGTPAEAAAYEAEYKSAPQGWKNPFETLPRFVPKAVFMSGRASASASPASAPVGKPPIDYWKKAAAFHGTRRVGEMIKCYYNEHVNHQEATSQCKRWKQNYGGSWYQVVNALSGKKLNPLTHGGAQRSRRRRSKTGVGRGRQTSISR